MVRCAVACVRAKSILKSVRDVRVCSSFSGVRRATVLLHTFRTKLPETATFCLKNYFRTSFPILEYLFLFHNTKNVEKLQEKD